MDHFERSDRPGVCFPIDLLNMPNQTRTCICPGEIMIDPKCLSTTAEESGGPFLPECSECRNSFPTDRIYDVKGLLPDMLVQLCRGCVEEIERKHSHNLIVARRLDGWTPGTDVSELPEPDIVIGGEEMSLQDALAGQDLPVPIISAPAGIPEIGAPWDELDLSNAQIITLPAGYEYVLDLSNGQIITLPAGDYVQSSREERGSQILWITRNELLALVTGHLRVSNLPPDARFEGIETRIERDGIGIRVTSTTFGPTMLGSLHRTFEAKLDGYTQAGQTNREWTEGQRKAFKEARDKFCAALDELKGKNKA
ncbi:MAG TPA: hypothetical protein VFE62_21035 [Gemmataceae bacterium]|nr:hypothetical protein [Gemmataceae bacterium]